VSIRVRTFYPELRRVAGNPEEIRVTGATVGECLADLVRQYPEAERLLFDRRGRLLKPVYVFVNREGMHKAEFSQPVTSSDELILAVLATGG